MKQKVNDLLQELTKTYNLIPCDEEKNPFLKTAELFSFLGPLAEYSLYTVLSIILLVSSTHCICSHWDLNQGNNLTLPAHQRHSSPSAFQKLLSDSHLSHLGRAGCSRKYRVSQDPLKCAQHSLRLSQQSYQNKINFISEVEAQQGRLSASFQGGEDRSQIYFKIAEIQYFCVGFKSNLMDSFSWLLTRIHIINPSLSHTGVIPPFKARTAEQYRKGTKRATTCCLC